MFPWPWNGACRPRCAATWRSTGGPKASPCAATCRRSWPSSACPRPDPLRRSAQELNPWGLLAPSPPPPGLRPGPDSGARLRRRLRRSPEQPRDSRLSAFLKWGEAPDRRTRDVFSRTRQGQVRPGPTRRHDMQSRELTGNRESARPLPWRENIRVDAPRLRRRLRRYTENQRDSSLPPFRKWGRRPPPSAVYRKPKRLPALRVSMIRRSRGALPTCCCKLFVTRVLQ